MGFCVDRLDRGNRGGLFGSLKATLLVSSLRGTSSESRSVFMSRRDHGVLSGGWLFTPSHQGGLLAEVRLRDIAEYTAGTSNRPCDEPDLPLVWNGLGAKCGGERSEQVT
jgi:hypothetical protein